MKILIVTQYFWPENFRINDLVSELALRGHEVTILTGKPNYPDGELFSEFKRSPDKFACFDACRVVRVPMVTRGHGSAIKLALNYFSYAFFASTVGLWRVRKNTYDLVFVFQLSPIFMALPALMYRYRYKKPVILYVQDLWPESLSSVGVVKSHKLLALIGKFVGWVYKQSDLIIGQSKAFKNSIQRYGGDPNKIRYLPNWSEPFFSPESCKKQTDNKEVNNPFVIMFAGNIGEAQDFPSILEAVEQFKAKKIAVKVLVVGDGRMYRWLVMEIQRRNLSEYIELFGRHPTESMPRFYAMADALLVTLKESPIFSMTIPSKIQTYMAAGKPILTMLTGEGSRVVQEAQCGFVALSGDIDCFTRNVQKMMALTPDALDLLGLNARAYAELEFNRYRVISQLEDWFSEIVEKHPKESL
jgi:glycosyltransferase involved in cell wall biosynthesis